MGGDLPETDRPYMKETPRGKEDFKLNLLDHAKISNKIETNPLK